MSRKNARLILPVAAFIACAGAGASPLVAPSPVTTCLRPAAFTPVAAACFAPGTPQEYADAFLARLGLLDTTDYFLTQRWTTTILGGMTNAGDPTTVTYSFPSDNLNGIGGGDPPSQRNVLNQKMVDWFGSVAAGKAKFRQVFDRWEVLSGLRYVETVDDDGLWGVGGALNVRGEIRIVAIRIDGGSGVLAFNFYPPTGEMVLDSSEGFSGSFGDHLFFRNVVAHEAGHGFGLLHVCPPEAAKLMEPFISIAYDGPRHDDTRAVQALYGDTRENNDSPAAATALGVLPESFAVINLSIDRAADPDYFLFNAGSAANSRDIVVSPIGFTYQQSMQSGGCPNGPFINTNEVQDLVLELLSADGSTVLAAADTPGFGHVERLTALALVHNTDYMLRVRSAASGALGNQSQLYRLDFHPGSAAACPGDANADGVVDFSDLNIVLGQFGQSGASLPGDLNSDGTVDFVDLNIVLSNFGTVC